MSDSHTTPPATRDTHVAASGDLPAYTLRRSTRAKHVRLRVSPREGLVIVVPARLRGFDPEHVLHERREWIAEALAHYGDRRAALLGGPDALLPSDVVFAATGESWHVEYRATGASGVRVRAAHGELVVSGDIEDGAACLSALRRWLHSAARERLLPMLAEESQRTGLAFARASVRGQRSRWGSCTSRGTITLNRALLFLPQRLARAVVLHELAHLRQPNHSAAFWNELRRLDPAADSHRKAIARAWDSVPAWAEP